MILFNLVLIEFDECLLLNLTLKVPEANAGITLSALLSILILVISKFEGWKSLVPLSNLIFLNSLKILISVVTGFFALCGYATWPWTPLIVSLPFILPRLPILIISPNLLGLVGSPTIQKSIFSFFFFKYSTTFFVPFIATPSSSPVINKLIEPLGFFSDIYLLTAETKAAIELFISFAPLPIKWPFLIAGLKGLIVQSLIFPGGTTSKWPAKQRLGLFVPNLAYKFFTGFVFFSANVKTLVLKPNDLSFFSKWPITPASVGVIDGNLISSLANWSSLIVFITILLEDRLLKSLI